MAGTSQSVRFSLEDLDKRLRDTFLEVVQHHHESLGETLLTVIALADKWCNSGAQQDFDALEECLENLKPDETILVRHLLLSVKRRRGPADGRPIVCHVPADARCQSY